jgi:hypothetical protein
MAIGWQRFRWMQLGMMMIPSGHALIERPGVIAVVSGDRTTYPQFASCIATLATPPNTRLFWQLAAGGGVAAARNGLVDRAIAARAGWVWFIDDDHVFPNDVLGNLLRCEGDIVVPSVLQRQPPHHHVAWAPFDVDATMSDDELVSVATAEHARLLVGPNDTGKVEIGLAGAGGMLVRMEVFERMPAPWFEWARFGADSAGEDTWFCLKARRLGFTIHCDLDTRIGHLTTCAVWPARDPQAGAISPAFDFDFREEALRTRAYAPIPVKPKSNG